MKPPSNPAPIPPQQPQDIIEILREVMRKIDLLTKRVERIEENQREYLTINIDEAAIPRTDISIALNHATPHHGGRVQSQIFNPTIGMPMHVGRSAASGSPSSSYHHLSAPSTPQRHQAPQSPRGHYQAKEEPLLPSASLFIPTPEQVASRLAEDESMTIGPPFFVVFSGHEPGVFTSWPYVMRTCKWLNGDWKRYETKSQALQAYEDAYIQGGLRFKK